MGNNLDSVIVTASYQDSKPSEHYYNEVDLLIVRDDDLHVWFEGTHYISKGIASTVNEGDLFLRTAPETRVHRVVSIDESEPSSALSVEIKVLYGPTIGSTESFRDKTSVDELTGQMENVPMGDPGPPILLEKY